MADFKSLVSRAEKVQASLPERARDAFFELVLHPAKAYAQVAELYIAAARNHLYAAQGRASANDFAAEVKALFQADIDLTNYYNHTLANGKWDHMMDQTHIGYTDWQEPPRNTMPAVKEIELPAAAGLGIAIEGSAETWPGATSDPVLPPFDAFNQQHRYIDIFAKGKAPVDFSSSASAPWITVSALKGRVEKEQRTWIGIDWSKAPHGSAEGWVKINDVTVKLHAFNPQEVTRASLRGFVEGDGYVSMEAEHYAKKVDAPSAKWEKIDDYGNSLSAMSVFPVNGPSMAPPRGSPCLEYKMYLFDTGKAEVDAVLSPSLNFVPGRGLRFAISFDDQAPQVTDAIGPIAGRDSLPRDWETIVKDSVRHVRTPIDVRTPGYHTLKVWMVDPAIVLERLVVEFGGVKPSYLGPPESYRR